MGVCLSSSPVRDPLLISLPRTNSPYPVLPEMDHPSGIVRDTSELLI